MAYYPKSQVKTNLYTSGNEFVVQSDRTNYEGSYWTNSKGQYFAGKNPQQQPTIQLLKVSPTETSDEVLIPKKTSAWFTSYPNQLLRDNPGVSPNKAQPTPTDDDYMTGEFTRYFTKKSNQNIYYEIAKSDYDKLVNQDDSIKWQLYQPIKIIWDLQGIREQVYQANVNTVLIAEKNQKLPGFRKIFKGQYLQYYK